jgi:prepilin-type N-terminal cleavage/methylation domain-containing protein
LTRIRNERGFTLVELLVALPMMLILLAGLSTTLVQMLSSSDKTEKETLLQTEARAALATLQTDVRQAFVGDGTTPFLSGTATSITFESPDRMPTVTTGSAQTSFHLRKITYTLSSGTLQRQFMTSTNTFPTAPPWTWPAQNGPVATVMGSITNTDVFTYYTEAGAQATPPTPIAFPIADTSGIRAVGIKLSLSTGGSQAKTFTFTQMVALRETDS